ncbi:MAG: tetratricopeptide repeat protein [Elusimicrobia bacterium]|nr:tetratricopeptide repeat protein [Elusimicrobiota bacterium]
MKRRLAFFLSIAPFFCAPPLSAAASSPEDSYHQYLKGLLHERNGRFKEALGAYEKAADLDPQSRFVHETLAFLSLRLEELNRALAEAETVVRLSPRDPRAHIVMGRIRLARNEIKESTESFDKALELDPASDEALLYAAHIRMQDRPEESLSYYKRFLQNNPQSVEARARLAEIQHRLGDIDSAEKSWRDVLALNPSEFSAHLALAHLYEIKKDTAAAIASYETCRFLDPQNAGILSRLGDLYYRSGDSAQAQEAFMQAERLAPDDLTIQFWMALLAEERRDWKAAVRHMSEVAAKSRETGILLRLAYYCSQSGEGERSVKTLKKIQKRDPDNPEFLYYVGLGYEDLHKPRTAIRWFERSLKKDEERADTHFHVGTNWDLLGKFDRAEPHLLRAVLLNPQHTVALNYLGYSWADRGMNLDKALAFIQRAMHFEPDNGAYVDSLGWTYFKLGRLTEAEAALSRAVHMLEDPVIWEHYGDVLEKAGKPQEAVRAWQEGLALDPKRKSLLKRIGSKGEPRDVLKRVEGNLRQLQSLTGSVDVGFQNGSRRVQAHGLFYYRKPQQFRMEFLGPFFMPQVLLVQTPSGMHWRSSKEDASDWPKREEWLRLLGDFLSGELLHRFDGADVRVSREGGELVYSAAFGELRIDGEKKVLTRATWKDAPPSGPVVHFRFEGYRDVEGLSLPSEVDCEIPSEEVKFSFDLDHMKINRPLDASLFQVPHASSE